MGLIKAVLGAAGGVLADQWKEYFYCDALPASVLVTKGQKRTTSRTTNTKGNDNIISNGSVVAVADGQAMIIVDQGKVVEFCAEPGEFVWDSSSEPSIFAGGLGKGILESFKVFGKRIGFGGDTAKDQRVYYFNTKEITDNKFGTPNPIPFRIVINEQLGFKMSVDLRMNGVYSYRLEDPIKFYANVCGNVESTYERSQIDGMLKAELMTQLQPALAKISALGCSYDQIPAYADDLVAALNEQLVDDWGKRGIVVFSMNLSVPSIPEEQRKKLTEWEENAMTMNPNVGAARLVGAQAEAMKTAAGNSAGAMNGFIGMGMVNGFAGQNVAALYQQGQNQPMQPVTPTAPVQPEAPAAEGMWTCPNCGKESDGAFCPKCGTKKVEARYCSKCGAQITDPEAMFCKKCGNKLD